MWAKTQSVNVFGENLFTFTFSDFSLNSKLFENVSCASDLIQYKHIHLAMGCITISGILNYLSYVKGLNIWTRKDIEGEKG